LIKNVDLYRQASLDASSSTFPLTGKEYICRISSSFRHITSVHIDDAPKVKLYNKISPSSCDLVSLWPHSIRSNIILYKTLFLNNLRFSADDFTTIRHSNDGCVLYESRKNQYSVGFILCIGHLVDTNEIYLLLKKVNISSTADTLNIRGRTFKCTNIMEGTVLPDSNVMIKPSSVIQKLAFRPNHDITQTRSNTFVFFQYPNLKECS
jgi:hypothetical protein